MILLIDNYDSFTYNLVHYLIEAGAKVVVKRNDDPSLETLDPSHYEGVVLSPGPCTPNEAGACLPVLNKWKGAIPIIYQRVVFAYPGHARNIGVELAKEEWIAFIDCRMIPDCDCLELSASTAEKSGAEFVGALRRSDADTHFKKILRPATWV